jgi:rhodanese-related sulfurtransferase
MPQIPMVNRRMMKGVGSSTGNYDIGITFFPTASRTTDRQLHLLPNILDYPPDPFPCAIQQPGRVRCIDHVRSTSRHKCMVTMMRQALWESVAIAIAGTVLGFLYTGITGQGVFSTREPESQTDEPAPEFIDYSEALNYHQSGKAIFIDARHDFDYGLGHIPGAVNLPLKEYDEKKSMLSQFSKDTTLVTYCDGQECNSSIDLALKLTAEGFSNVMIFFDGWREWESHHEPTEQLRQ